MNVTEQQIKIPIDSVLRDAAFDALFLSREQRAKREYRLATDPAFRADFACRLRTSGWLFVEDDDAQRALSNLVKYWWCLEHSQVDGEVHLVHLIGPGYPGQRELCSFVSAQIKDAFPNFSYHLIEVNNWHGGRWLDKFRSTIERIGGMIERNV